VSRWDCDFIFCIFIFVSHADVDNYFPNTWTWTSATSGAAGGRAERSLWQIIPGYYVQSCAVGHVTKQLISNSISLHYALVPRHDGGPESVQRSGNDVDTAQTFAYNEV